MKRKLLPVAVLAVAVAAGPGGAAPAAPAPFHDDCGLEPPSPGSPAIAPAPRKPRQLPATAAATPLGPLIRRVDATSARNGAGGTGNLAEGALSGKTVYLSAGHGFTWVDSLGWRTQRGNTNGIVEDLVSIEVVDQYLVTYLRNMGAYVVTVREADMRTELVVVDDADATAEGTLSEGPAGPAGWGQVATPITDQTNPFGAGGTRTLVTAPVESGRLVYAAQIPASGYYNVYASWAQDAYRASDAHYVVRHAGGEAHLRVDQRRHGSTWVLLGRWWFQEAAPPQQASIAVANDSADAAAGAVVSLDAVRFGGGMGVIDRGGGVSGRPMYENSSRYYAQLAGAPASVYDARTTDGDDDVVTRSRFTAWDHEPGEDAVYLAWHTNAPNPARGTDTYTYSPDPPPGPLANFSGAPGSRELQDAVHTELIGDLKAAWDPAWPDRGQHCAYFGEVNPAHNPDVPAVLVEVAFHDTPTDADALRDPRFRRIAARAMAQGIARYFGAATLPPEPPVAVRVENDGQGALLISWRPPAPDGAGGDPADGYRVYLSRDGYAFDDGTDVGGGQEHRLSGLGGGETRYVRVAARNAGGESLPSEVVGARAAAAGVASVLVVGGFDRLDGALLPVEDLSAHALGLVDRMWLDRINDGTYAARHGAAIAFAGVSFDGAADEAVELGDVALAPYQAVDWFLGEESAGDEPLNAAARSALVAYLDAGGRLFLTGAEVGWAMDYLGTPEEQTFFRDRLHTTYVADDAETYDVTAVEGPFGGLAPLSFADPARHAYDAEWPDVLAPGAGAAMALGYSGGAGGTAAIFWGGAGAGERGVHFGFPFETITGADARGQVMDLTLAFLQVTEEPDFPDGGIGPDGGPGNDDGSGGCGCRTTRGSGPAAPALLLLLLLPSGVLIGRLRSPWRIRKAWSPPKR